jgi:hypothetical protein
MYPARLAANAGFRSCLALALAPFLGACGADRAPAPEDIVDEPRVIPGDAVEVVAQSDLLAEVRDLEIGDDGTVWLLNGSPPFLVGFRGAAGPATAGGAPAASEAVVSGGVRGQGPGELVLPGALVRLDSGVWVFDFRLGVLMQVSPPDGPGPSLELGPTTPGVAVRDADGRPMPSVSFAMMLQLYPRPWVAPEGERVLLARAPAGPQEGLLHLWNVDFVAYTTTDGQEEVRFAARDHLGPPEERYAGASLFLPVPFWASCPDGTFVAYDPVRNTLGHVGPTGAPLGTAQLPPPREIEATPDLLFDFLTPMMVAGMGDQAPPLHELRTGFMAEFEQARAQLSSVIPEYRGLACAPGGDLWLQVVEVGESARGEGGRWLRIRPGAAEGDRWSGDAEVAAFRFPETFRPLRFLEAEAWGVAFDALEVPSLARMPLPD